MVLATEKTKEYRRNYYLRNREKAIAYSLQWKRENREKNRESSRRSAATIRDLDPSRVNASAKKWRDNNSEKVKQINAEWRKRNPEYWWKWRCGNIKKWIVKRAKSGAKVAGVPFSLTVDDIVIPDVCPALGIKLDIGAGRTAPNSIALDRIIPDLGYVPTNVRVISRRANFIKNNATAAELEAIAAYIRRES